MHFYTANEIVSQRLYSQCVVYINISLQSLTKNTVNKEHTHTHNEWPPTITNNPTYILSHLKPSSLSTEGRAHPKITFTHTEGLSPSA